MSSELKPCPRDPNFICEEVKRLNERIAYLEIVGTGVGVKDEGPPILATATYNPRTVYVKAKCLAHYGMVDDAKNRCRQDIAFRIGCWLLNEGAVEIEYKTTGCSLEALAVCRVLLKEKD